MAKKACACPGQWDLVYQLPICMPVSLGQWPRQAQTCRDTFQHFQPMLERLSVHAAAQCSPLVVQMFDLMFTDMSSLPCGSLSWLPMPSRLITADTRARLCFLKQNLPQPSMSLVLPNHDLQVAGSGQSTSSPTCVTEKALELQDLFLGAWYCTGTAQKSWRLASLCLWVTGSVGQRERWTGSEGGSVLMLTQRGQRQGCFLQHQRWVGGWEHPRSVLCF